MALWFLVGSLVRGSEWVGRKVAPDRLGGRHLLIAAAGMMIFAVPASVYSYLVAPDWAWMYWLDPRPLPAAVVIPASVAVDVLALVAGARLNRWAAGRFGLPGGAAVHLAGVAAIGVLTAVGWSQLMHVGDAQAFAAGTATPLWRVQPLFTLFLVSGAGFGLTLAGMSFLAGRKPRAAA
ncbi:MAG TPA: hypothetical protein VGQ83_39940 [Polyangia bacterium]